MAAETRQANAEFGYWYSDLCRLSFFEFVLTELCFMVSVCVFKPFHAVIFSRKDSLIVYFRGKLQIQFAGW
jgi:hypothetical protein